MCYRNRQERQIGGEGAEEKEGYHSVIKTATEKQELPTLSMNLHDFIKKMGKTDRKWNYDYYWIIILCLLHIHPFYTCLCSRKVKAHPLRMQK